MIRIAVVGAGHWGPNLIRNFEENDESTVDAVVELDEARRRTVAERYPSVEVTADLGQVLRSPVDAVVIATPTSTHHVLAKQALEHDKHVLVEKPIATDPEAARELCQIADERGLKLMVGHVFVFNDAVRRVKRYIDSGELGDIHYIASVRTNLGPIRADVNAAWDLATHDISIANYWLEATPARVSAVGGSWINPDVEDAVFATLKYPDGVLVNMHASWLNPRKTRDITVVGEDRMLTFSDMDLSEPIRVYDKTVSEERTEVQMIDTFTSFRASVREGEITIPRVPMGEPLRAECDHFVRSIIDGTRPLADGRSGLDVVEVLDAIARSMKNGGAEEEVR